MTPTTPTSSEAWILLLRGVNVGGRHSLPMRELVEILESLGLEDVRTYIQSGNAVFRAPRGVSASQADEIAAALAEEVAAAIRARRGFRPRALVLGAERLERAAAASPFQAESDADDRSVHVSFLVATPETPDLDGLSAIRAPSERFHLDGDVFYLHAPEGIGRSKLATRAERLLGVEATARNWRTVRKLQEMTRGGGQAT